MEKVDVISKKQFLRPRCKIAVKNISMKLFSETNVSLFQFYSFILPTLCNFIVSTYSS